MESTKNTDLQVGIFITLGIVVLFSSVLLLGGDKIGFKKFNVYIVKLKQAQGLGPGSIVSFAGIKIGSIKKIEFRKSGDNIQSKPLMALLEVEDIFKNKITTTTTATIKTQGALGDKFIDLAPGDTVGSPLSDGQSIISNGSADILDSLASKSNEFNKIADIINETHKLIYNINKTQITTTTLQNLHSSTEKLNSLLTGLQLLVKDIRGNPDDDNSLKTTLIHLSTILQKIDSGQGSLGAFINDPTLHSKLITFLGASPQRKLLKPLIRATIEENDRLK